MRILAAAVAGTILLLAGPQTATLFGSPPRLVFDKEIPLKQEQGTFTYKVRKGEYIYSILRSLKVSESNLPRMARKVKKLNPHIENPNRIDPGQTLHLPESLKSERGGRNRTKAAASSPPSRPATPGREPGPITTVTHRVRPGESVAAILRQEAGLGNDRIFFEYVNIFRKLNPQISNVNNLEVGQVVTVPVPAEKSDVPGTGDGGPDAGSVRIAARHAQANATQRQRSATDSRPKPKRIPKPRKPSPHAGNKAMALAMLKKMGFRFAPGREVLYPFGQSQWIQINLDRMPLANPPWGGSSVIFIPESLTFKIDVGELEQAGLTVCRVDRTWSPDSVFERLEQASGKKLLFWDKDHDLILSGEQNVLELKTDYQLVVKSGEGKEYYLFHTAGEEATPPSKFLLGYLERKNVHLYVMRPSQRGRPRFLSRKRPSEENLYTPTISASGSWQDLRPCLGKAVRGLQPESPHFQDVFRAMREKGVAERTSLRMQWLSGSPHSITLTLPVIKVKGANETAYILTPKQADPYLVSLISMKGYTCYVLSK
jgi:LysM repeat protein